MKEEIAKLLKKPIKELGADLSKDNIIELIEIPKDYSNGDFAFPCFIISKQIKENPHEIAIQLRKDIGDTKQFEKIQTAGPYINFFINRKEFSKEIINIVTKQKDKFGSSKDFKGKKAFIEFSSPNIAKPFGIGHLRSTIIGNSIAKLCSFQGYKTLRANYLGDWGSQFGKLMHAYEKFGDEKQLIENPMKHLYEIYVKINSKKEYDEHSREWFNKLEKGDKEAKYLWKRFREISLKEFERIYEIMGIKFDVMLCESMYEKEMKSVTALLKKKKLLKESEGAEIINLEKYNLGIALIQKSDGSTLYATRDLASAISRKEKYNFDIMVYEVGQEQSLHFQQIFKILELMGYDWAKKCFHVSHGLYLGKDGKRLATRKGKTFFMEEIIEDTKKLAKKEIKKRFPKLKDSELDKRSLTVALAAIYYGDLKNNRTNNIVFDPEKFVSFEGDTGPYLLYSYARAKSIIRKYEKEKKKSQKVDFEKADEKEFALIKKISEFPQVAKKAYEQTTPYLVANYSYSLAQYFNEFYHTSKVIGSEKEYFRIQLVEIFAQTLKNSLHLLGIETLEEM
jgi:arginyl-tRNA synthetase